MFNYIEKLRQKPDNVKKHIAFFVAFSFVGIIFVVWLSTIYPGFQQEKQINDRVASSGGPSPVSTFVSILSQSVSTMSEQFSKIKETSTSILSGTDHIISTTTQNNIVSTSTKQ